MELVFLNNRIQRLCASFAKLRAELGQATARTVIGHIASLRAASCLEEMRHLPGRCRKHEGQLALTLPNDGRLIFEPTDNPAPTVSDGGVDWAATRTVRILAIRRGQTTSRR